MGDHPRVCGEKVLWYYYIKGMTGSPPRVRGKDATSAANRRGSRITPACAGKRRRLDSSDTVRKDHPRVCGEKWISFRVKSLVTGSPPRVRGKGSRSIHRIPQRGITPACAGKSTFEGTRYTELEDHPRVCGEKSLQHSAYHLPAWITPACAGKRTISSPVLGVR